MNSENADVPRDERLRWLQTLSVGRLLGELVSGKTIGGDILQTVCKDVIVDEIGKQRQLCRQIR